jgi:very-short-patch-repair endonuclease
MAADDDLWLSQRTISELLRTTPQNVVLHLRDMSKTDANPVQRSIRLASIEGTRRIVRSIKHFNLATAASVAVRARRFEEHSALLRIAADRGVAVPEVRVSPVKERRFSELVLGIFADVTEVETQRRVGAYRIDFVLPEIDLAIEYDEDHHDSPARRRADQARQAAIETTTRLRFLRVKQGDEIRGINAILLRLLSVRDREAHRSQ